VRNEPNWAGRLQPRRVKYAKRIQFARRGRVALPRPSTGGGCAKRTQFGEQIVQNEPNFRQGEARGTWGVARIVQKKPNMPGGAGRFPPAPRPPPSQLATIDFVRKLIDRKPRFSVY
jgi:hypothetical protein